jgi:hypothetical protein
MTTTRRPSTAPGPAVPADWCPTRPGVERVARLLLNRERPDLRYDLVDPRDVLTALAHRWPGNQLPDIVASRDRLLAEETARCAAVAGLYAEVLRLAQLELGEAS